MVRRFDDEEDDDVEEEEYEDEEEQLLDDEDYDLDEDVGRGRGGSSKKRGRSDFIDDLAEEDDEEDEEDDDEVYGGGGGRGGKRHKAPRDGSQFFDLEAQVDSDEEEEEDEGEDGFIVDSGADMPDEDVGRRMRRPLPLREDEQEDVEALERSIQARYARSSHAEYDEETTDVEQQALLPSVRDPKLWMVKCAIGRERETAVCLMQKYIDKGSELQIRSVIALDHLKNYIYIEADKEAHVREVVDVDNVRQRVTVKLIPRIDLQALANKLEGREVAKKKAFVPPPRFMNVDEARELHIRVEHRRDPMSGDYFENIGGMLFKDGFLYKTVSMKSISAQNIKPTFDELEKFRTPSVKGEGEMVGLSTLFANRKKGHFMKGDAVIVVKGDLKNLKGWVEKVEEENVHIRPEMKGLPKTLAVNEKELCKYFEPGNHVKVVAGTKEGATGMVVKVEQHVLIILSDTTKEHIRVFADDVVESSEVTTGVTKIGDYELHDLVLLDNNSFGVIIRVEREAFQVLKGVPERPEVSLVKLREIKCKLEKKFDVQDRYRNTVSVKDVVRILEGSCKGKQGPVEHIYKGVLFVYDRHHLEHAGFICAKAGSCCVVGGARSNGNRNGDSLSRFGGFKAPPRVPPSPRRFSRGGPPFDCMLLTADAINICPFETAGGRHRGGRGGHDALVGTTVKIRQGPYKGYRGRVVDIKVDRNFVSDNVVISTPHRETSRYGMGSETPMRSARTPLHPYMTPMRDPGATSIPDGMRTPMGDRAWNPYAPMSPSRDNWEEGNPASWGTSPQYQVRILAQLAAISNVAILFILIQSMFVRKITVNSVLFQPGSPPSRAYEAPTPGSGWASTPGGSYSEAGTPRDSGSAYGNAPSPYMPSTPSGQPMTPSSGPYIPGTPGGQPMTPGTGGLDAMSPVIGPESEGPWFVPDILVNVHKSGDETLGVIQEVLPDGSCKVALGSSGSGDTVIAMPSEMEIIPPKKSDKIKIMGGSLRGLTGKLIGVDGTDGIVRIDDSLDVKILDLVILAKLP
ncbi:Global transcription factor group A2 isoform 1 [Gossypium australe]|uniref:Transcription elongation factor SPT5 n=1 Tax=Gossypium australe TaxID=47621 RepID=A0A5B6U643_9ROSI|nr:Global transcription factor group A2 isoform 1 [Gossypium australe]